MSIGTAVTTAVARYHSAIVAQGFATLEEMFPGRVFLDYGSAESLNESPPGFDWPSGSVQLEQMKEALTMFRALFAGERVDGAGKHFATQQAKLNTLPESPPPILCLRVPRARGEGRGAAGILGSPRVDSGACAGACSAAWRWRSSSR